MNNFLEALLPALANALIVIIIALSGYLITYIDKKKEQIQTGINSEIGKKYSNMIASTIANCVATTTQTYVEALKKQNAFTSEAQKEAFNLTLLNIKEILTLDALEYLSTITDDLDKFLTNAIEAEVKAQKIL